MEKKCYLLCYFWLITWSQHWEKYVLEKTCCSPLAARCVFAVSNGERKAKAREKRAPYKCGKRGSHICWSECKKVEHPLVARLLKALSSEISSAGCFASSWPNIWRLIKTIIKFMIFNYSVEKVCFGNWQQGPMPLKSNPSLKAHVQDGEYVDWSHGSEIKKKTAPFVWTSPLGMGAKMKVKRKRRLEECPAGERKEKLLTWTKRVLKERSVWSQSIWTCLLCSLSFPAISHLIRREYSSAGEK